MTTDTRLEAMQKDIRYLLDRTEILDCIARHARGCDRHDIDLISSAYNDDGIDEHGFAVNAGPDYGAWANKTHAETSRAHTHNITTHSCDIDGDTAHVESYAIVVMIAPDGKTAQFISGRYIDLLERRDGQWRITIRRSTVEGMFIADARVLLSPFFTEKGYLVGTRDRTDLSYERPLSMDTPAPARW
jgi:ketosteroid isomerase-like protein